MKNITVSVVMAVYNSEKYLQQAVESLLSQTMSDIELILVDDGSSDESMKILRRFEKLDDRVTVLQNTVESDGAAAARNLGVSKARGKYLSIVDADDFFEPDMLAKAYATAERYHADVVVYDGYRYDDQNDVDLERDTILYKGKLPDISVKDEADGSFCFCPQDNPENLFLMTLGAAWNVLFSHKLVRENELGFAPFHHADDYEFVFTAFALADHIAILPQRLIHYRVNHAGTQASNVTEWPDTAWQSMISFKNRLMQLGLYDTYKTAFLRFAMSYQVFYLNAMKTPAGFSRLYASLKNDRLKELGLKDATEEELGDDNLIIIRDCICRYDAAEYLFCRMHNLPPFDEGVRWKKMIPVGSRIILYGADRLGVSIFHEILWNLDYRLVSWMDKQYRSIGYPVEDPAGLQQMDYDRILVAARSKNRFLEIREELLSLGAEEEKILWNGM